MENEQQTEQQEQPAEVIVGENTYKVLSRVPVDEMEESYPHFAQWLRRNSDITALLYTTRELEDNRSVSPIVYEYCTDGTTEYTLVSRNATQE